MATDIKTKRERLFDRTYDDKNGKSAISLAKTGELQRELSVADAHSDVLTGGALRYLTDGWVSAYTNALKAEGGTHEKALEAADAYWDAVCSGEYAFRAGAGESGLTLEQEREVIAKVAVEGGFATSNEDALRIIDEAYAVTRTRKQTVKGVEREVIDHPEYNKIKRIPQVREALAKASGDDSAEQLTGVFGKKAA